MALNPVAYTEKVVRSFLRYQLSAYPFADPRLHKQMRELLSLDSTRQSPLLKGPYVSLSQPFRPGATIDELVSEQLLHPHLRERIPNSITRLYSHQERAIRSIGAGRTTLVSTGTGSGKTECFLYPVVSKCLSLRDQYAPAGISAVIVYPMNALAEDQLMRLRSLLAGTGIPFGMYVGKTKEGESDIAGVRLKPGDSRADYEARLEAAKSAGTGETVHPAEEVCSRDVMRTPGQQPRVLLTNVKQLELLLTRQVDIELFANARLDFLVFDEAHTFAGALGAETACLIRRLRSFCNVDPEHSTCIATSATIMDREDPGAACKFAARFFGVSAQSVTAVGEEYEPEAWAASRFVPGAPKAEPSDLLAQCLQAVEDEEHSGRVVREAYVALAGNDLETSANEWPTALHAALSRNEIVFRIREALATPKALDELPENLERNVGRPVTESEILAWLALGAAARREGRPLLRPVVHGFVRGIGGAVVSFPDASEGPRLWLAAEDEAREDGNQGIRAIHAGRPRFPVTTCTTCGQHYYVAFLEDFEFHGREPGGGRSGSGGIWWSRQDPKNGGRRLVMVDRLIGEDDSEDDAPLDRHTAVLHFCCRCGAAHPESSHRCLDCGSAGDMIQLHAVRQKKERVGNLTRCLSCGSAGREFQGRYREPARPVRATIAADVHVLTQDMVHRAERRRLLVFCDNRQDAAFQAGWMRDHARRFRLRALMADGFRDRTCSVSDLAAYMDDVLDGDTALSRALVPEVWQVARRESGHGRHEVERRKYLRFQVLLETTISSRQALGLEPWGRMRVDYDGLDSTAPWIQDYAHKFGVPADRLRDGVAGVLDYLRRSGALYDPEHRIFSKYWMEGDREIQQGYLTSFTNPKATKLRRDPQEKKSLVIQWLSDAGETPLRQVARKWDVAKGDTSAFLESLFAFLIEKELLIAVRLTGSKGRPLPNVHSVYQVDADRLRLGPHRGVYRCKRCRRTTTRALPHERCLAWRCDGEVEWVQEDRENYDLQLLDGAYAMLRPEEHTAMVPTDHRERLENLFKGDSETVNCLVCTPTLELGIDIGQLDAVLMRNVPPLPSNYWQRVGRAGRRHRMAVALAYCRPTSHDRAYFADPPKLLGGPIDPPAFNLRNEVMVAKHVRATVIAALHQYGRDAARSQAERDNIQIVLSRCLPRRVEGYLFEYGDVRLEAFDFNTLRDLVHCYADDLTESVRDVFEQGWPDADADVTEVPALRKHVGSFPDELEKVVARLRERLRWALRQIARLNGRRTQKGTLDPDEEALFRRCDTLVKQLKGARRRRSQAAGHDDSNTYSVLAAEGFLPGYGLEVGSVTGWAEIPFWHDSAMSFALPRPPAVALREYVPGNLIYANGHRFVARRFHRDVQRLGSGSPGTPPGSPEEMPHYEVSTEREAIRQSEAGGSKTLGSNAIQTIGVCDVDLSHSSHISDEEELRFQMGVATFGLERGQHSGGRAFRWGRQPLHLRRGVRLRLVNVGPSAAVKDGGELGYPVCAVCGQSVSPLSSQRQRENFSEEHVTRCGHRPKAIGFHADVVADVLSLPSCGSPYSAYSVLEAMRIATTRLLDMQMDDLQILVIGHIDREEVDGLLWDPMPGGSGLLSRLCERFMEVATLAREVIDDCPSDCESSCIDCLQTFRNAYYHRYLDRKAARERLDAWRTDLTFAHEIPSTIQSKPNDGDGLPVNDAEVKLRYLLQRAGFSDGVRGEQIRLQQGLGTTTPDVIYRAAHHEPNEGVCIYLDGMGKTLHGDPKTAAKDREIRTWLRNEGDYDVIEISVNQLDDEGAMTRHLRRLATYLERPDLRARVRQDTSWFREPSVDDEQRQ